MTIIKDDSIWAANVESTEGTYAAPASATDGYIQANMDGTELVPNRELKERATFTGTLAASNPRLGIAGVTGSISVEAKASGTEGGAPDYGVLLQGVLPDVDTIGSRVTTKASGNTGSVLQIEDADISAFVALDTIVVLESGGYHPCVVTAVDSTGGAANITITPSKASGSFSNSVLIAKAKTYKPADTSHPSFSVTGYVGDGVREAGLGCRTTSIKLSSFNTGELPKLDFGFEGLSYTMTASTSASHTPTFDTSLPSVVLNARVYKGGTVTSMEGVELNIEQPVSFLKATSSANGKTAGRASGKRKITGTIKPYTDETSVANFTNWANGTTFSLFFFSGTPSSTAGEYTLGTLVMYYMPACFITSVKYADIDGVVVDEIAFQATGGDTGQASDIVIGFC